MLHPQAVAEPNVWVPRKLEKEWRQLPTNEAQATILANCSAYARTDLQRDIDAGWQAIAAASVDEALRAKN
jgi:hypothetical protein